MVVSWGLLCMFFAISLYVMYVFIFMLALFYLIRLSGWCYCFTCIVGFSAAQKPCRVPTKSRKIITLNEHAHFRAKNSRTETRM
jgi:hypothetical protein